MDGYWEGRVGRQQQEGLPTGRDDQPFVHEVDEMGKLTTQQQRWYQFRGWMWADRNITILPSGPMTMT